MRGILTLATLPVAMMTTCTFPAIFRSFARNRTSAGSTDTGGWIWASPKDSVGTITERQHPIAYQCRHFQGLADGSLDGKFRGCFSGRDPRFNSFLFRSDIASSRSR